LPQLLKSTPLGSLTHAVFFERGIAERHLLAESGSVEQIEGQPIS
jgi:hypothetical protein